jgi:hypothetical protein
MSFKERYISQTEKNNGKEIIQKYEREKLLE